MRWLSAFGWPVALVAVLVGLGVSQDVSTRERALLAREASVADDHSELRRLQAEQGVRTTETRRLKAALEVANQDRADLHVERDRLARRSRTLRGRVLELQLQLAMVRAITGQDGVGCDRVSYANVCIAHYPPDLDCSDVPHSDFRVTDSDPHGFDGDSDGEGCET